MTYSDSTALATNCQ